MANSEALLGSYKMIDEAYYLLFNTLYLLYVTLLRYYYMTK